MARIRTVKPEFFSDEGIASCTPHARLLAIAVLQLCDVAGRFRWLPMQVHAHAFPFESCFPGKHPGASPCNIEVLAGELESIGYLQRYDSEGKKWCVVWNFRKHQRLTGKEADSESVCPEPPIKQDVAEGNTGETPRCFPEKYLDAQEREEEEEREQGKRNRGKGTVERAKSAKQSAKDLNPPAWMGPELLEDLKTHRKYVKAPLSQRALDGIAKEAEKAAGAAYVTCAAEAVERMISRGWRGLESDWLAPKPNGGGGGRPEKFNPTEYINRNRIKRNDHGNAERIIRGEVVEVETSKFPF